MAYDDDTDARRRAPDDEATQRERREMLRLWKLKWSRLLRMRVTDKHIASLVGLTGGTITRKRNGRLSISKRMKPALTNIDTVIDCNRMPDDCPDDLRHAIISYQVRHPLSR